MVETNSTFWAVLAIVGGFAVLDFIADWLNLRALRTELPERFAGRFDAETYAKAQRYTRARTRFGLLESAISLLIFLAFWLLGGFGWLDQLVRSWGWGPIVNGLLYFALLGLATLLIGLPFALYSTFKIEQAYGFNKTTLGLFISDQFKGILLSVAIGGPLLALLLLLFERFALAWLYGWVAVTAFTLLMSWLAPVLILPLFNTFKPLEDDELKTEIEAMAARCEFPLAEVSIMDGSKRSTKSNAFFTGFGRHKKIALFDTLVAQHSVRELVAVLAHEIGHYKRRHILQRLVLGIGQTGALFYLLGVFMNNAPLHAAFGVAEASVYGSFVFFSFLYTPVSRLLAIGMAVLSRKHEFEADAYAAEVTGDPEAMVSALEKLAVDNLSNLTPHPLYVFMHYSHPPLPERLAALERRTAA